jgi:hypothetical protein
MLNQHEKLEPPFLKKVVPTLFIEYVGSNIFAPTFF